MGLCFSYGRGTKKAKKQENPVQYHPKKSIKIKDEGRVHVYGAEAFELVGQLGSGRNGSMRLMRNKKSKEMVAVKFVEREAGAGLSKNTEREIINHRRLLHENIIRFHEVYVTETHLAIVMEYASGGTLAQRINESGPLPEPKAKEIFLQLISGMDYCHGLGIFHRDLRLENVLLQGPYTQPQVKITGFGYSKSAIYDSQPKTNVGSPSYTPPELLSYTRHEGAVYDGATVNSKFNYDLGSSNDIWSAGVILYYILTGILPFEDSAMPGALSRKMMQKIVNVEYTYPANIQLSPEIKDFLSKIFVKDPVDRAKVAQMRQHPWLVGVNMPTDVVEVQQSSQTEQEISAIVEKARKRRQQQNARKRGGGSGPSPHNSGLQSHRSRNAADVALDGKGTQTNEAPGLTGIASLDDEDGIEEVKSARR